MIDLNIVWCGLIGILFAGFYVLEGFDFGVGMLVPFIGKNDAERRTLINAIGPFWDGNEVWFLTAGGAIFAAFPHWYATLFSSCYLALLGILVGLILRGVSIEFRSKVLSQTWRTTWDWLLALGSFIPSLVLGVAFVNLNRGLAINSQMEFTGSFADLFSPYSIVGGLASLSLCLLQGASFLSLKLEGDLCTRVTDKLQIMRLVSFLLVLALTFFWKTLEVKNFGGLGIHIALIVLMLGSFWAIKIKRFGMLFVMTSLSLALFPTLFFVNMFPKVMVSSTNTVFSLDIYNASSSPYTLQIMSIVALCFVPVVLLYQAWSYWIFKKRLNSNSTLHY